MTTPSRSLPDHTGAHPQPVLAVVHIIVDLERGGAERMLERLVLDPTAFGLMHQQVVSLGAVGPIGHELRKVGVQVHSLGMSGVMHVPLALYRLRRLLKRLRPDLVQTWMYHADLLGGIAARSLGLPIVWNVRTTSLGSGNAKATRLVRWFCAALSAHIPDAVIFVAEAAKRSHEAVGYASRIMQVIPNGFEMASREQVAKMRETWRREHSFAAKDIVIGWVGRFNPDKDAHSFIQAGAAVMLAEDTVKIAMVGRGVESSSEELQRWIQAEEPKRPFLLLGEQSETTPCFCGFDVFALSSRTEAFPNVVAEAMAVGLPCVVTDVGDVRFLVDQAAQVVGAGDVPAMTDELLRLIRDPVHRASMGQSARQRISEQFSMAACVNQFHKVYQGVLSSKST